MPDRGPWWQDAVVYQVYLRSFADGNGDGIGDLPGLRSRLAHIRDLGVDGIWLNPCYPSPQRDHGYDIANYLDIDPDYGTLADFDGLLADCRALGLKVLLDLVANHCSSDHPWFVEALATGAGSAERDRFLFRDGRGPAGERPPNNWESVFGGPAWTRVEDETGQWYLHLFDPSQPDFNWRNPDVLAHFEDVLDFWFARGVDGFRLDVAHGLLKHPDLPDWPAAPDGRFTYNTHMWNQDGVHDIYRAWRRVADRHGPKLFIGEVWVPEPADLRAYLRQDELHQAFFFDLLAREWSAPQYRETIERGLAAGADRPTWTIANHDVPRAVTRLGTTVPAGIDRGDVLGAARARGPVDARAGDRRARAALLMLLALPGSVYLYQGEELGLPEVLDLPDGARQDPIWARTGGAEPGRDGCRVPLPWRADAPSFGFSPPGAAAPWLPQPDWFAKFAAETLAEDADSFLTLNRAAIRLRARDWTTASRSLTWLPTGHPDVLAFARGEHVCVTNFGALPFPVPEQWGAPTLASAALVGGRVPAEATAWLR